jgi:hypothetical protein
MGDTAYDYDRLHQNRAGGQGKHNNQPATAAVAAIVVVAATAMATAMATTAVTAAAEKATAA